MFICVLSQWQALNVRGVEEALTMLLQFGKVGGSLLTRCLQISGVDKA